MSRGLRFALMCWLALALSVQGFAARAMLPCEPAQHQASHEPCADMGQARSDAGDAAAEPAEPAEQAGAGQCSGDPACCSGAAITTDFGFAPAPATVQPRALAAIPQGIERLLIGGLDRPPR